MHLCKSGKHLVSAEIAAARKDRTKQLPHMDRLYKKTIKSIDSHADRDEGKIWCKGAASQGLGLQEL